VRGARRYDLLQALNTGHAGTLSTIHANSASQALARLASCVLQAGVDLPYVAIRSRIADAIGLVLQARSARRCSACLELLRLRGYAVEGDRYETDELYDCGTVHQSP